MMNRKKLASLIIGFLCISNSYGSQINEKNWMTHPEIIKIRKIFQEVEQKSSSGDLKIVSKSFEYCMPYQDSIREIYYEKNVPRKYYFKKGSEDSLIRGTAYYDESGDLVFVFIQAGAAMGSSIEYRIYYKDGRRIWHDRRIIEGHGEYFEEVWPDSEILFKPIEAFNGANKCAEYK